MALTKGASLPEGRFGRHYMDHKPTKSALMWYGSGMETITNTLGTLWESYLVRLTVLALALGAAPFYFLSLAVAQVGG